MAARTTSGDYRPQLNTRGLSASHERMTTTGTTRASAGDAYRRQSIRPLASHGGMTMTAKLANICDQFKKILVSRDAAFYWGPALTATAAGVDAYCKTSFYPTVRSIVSDANALSGVTFPVDGVNAGRRAYREGNLVEWLASIFLTTSATDASSIACENGHCPGQTERATVEFLDTVGSLSKAVWTWDRVQEIRVDDYVKGAEGGQAQLAQGRQAADLARYTIWTASAMSAVIFSYLSSQGNYFAKVAGSFAEEYAVSLTVNGVRGALGLVGFIIGLNLVGRAPVKAGAEGARYQTLDAAKDAMGGSQAARDKVKGESEFTSIWDKAQYIVKDRKKTRSASKVLSAGLWVIENLSNAAGWASAATGAANFSRWLKKKQTFCKLASVPGWIKTGINNGNKHLHLDAPSAKAWLEWGFVGFYDVCAVPTYLYDKAGAELPTNTKWFLKEATRHWCSLFQAAALAIEFGCNVESKPHKNAAGIGARERFINGATHLADGTAMDEANWRDAVYLVDRVAVMSMTALTLYRWVCDVRGEKFASFGSLMLFFDAAKAGTGLAKELWEDQDSSGFIEQQANAYLKKYGAPAQA